MEEKLKHNTEEQQKKLNKTIAISPKQENNLENKLLNLGKQAEQMKKETQKNQSQN